MIRGAESGGRIESLPVYVVRSANGDSSIRCPTEIQITDREETEFTELGLLPLCHYLETDYAVFFGATTLHKPKQYEKSEATANAAITARLPYIMTTSRFVQTLMAMARARLSDFMEKDDTEKWMQAWLNDYIAPAGDHSATTKARHPLQHAAIKIGSIPGKPGQFSADLHIQPFLPYEELSGPGRMKFTFPIVG